MPAGAEDSATELGLTGFGGMVVDDAHDRVYVSGSVQDNAIAVVDFDGTHMETIPGIAGASGMVVTGDRLWVIARTAAAHDEIDLNTYERVARHPLEVCVGGRLERSGHLLWMTSSTCGSGDWG